MILLAVACLGFVSCDSTPKPTEPTEATTCDALTQEQQDNWAKYAELTPDEQIALVGEMKAYFDACYAKCEAKCEAKEEGTEPAVVDPEKEAARAEFKAKWDAFDTLTLEEQKALLDQAFECKAKCCKAEEAPVQE